MKTGSATCRRPAGLVRNGLTGETQRVLSWTFIGK
jgi:hypothetical protein